mmetsp:Transcript_31748/g.82958  ORF Transcript_31748/g.82958 Transcript_31748/m.82958 type:complete len:88 (+) Transcript_31748:316-579(+)
MVLSETLASLHISCPEAALNLGLCVTDSQRRHIRDWDVAMQSACRAPEGSPKAREAWPILSSLCTHNCSMPAANETLPPSAPMSWIL